MINEITNELEAELEQLQKMELGQNEKGEKYAKVIQHLNNHYYITYNVISNTLIITRKEAEPKEYLNENTVFIELQELGVNFSLGDLKAYCGSTKVKQVHPFKDYFESLPAFGDGPSEIDRLSTYVTLARKEDISRFRRQFRKMFIRMVACAISEKHFNKQCFVLISSAQNIGKTTFVRWLCPPKLKDYFTENLPPGKDGKLAMCENFIILIDELAVFNKREINDLKSMFSLMHDKSRRPFDARATTRFRWCSFLATTNDVHFLTDKTGNVRWVCFEIVGINFAYQRDIDIDKVWAEAYHLFQSGQTGELTKEEIIENEACNSSYMVLDEETELIVQYYKQGSATDFDAFYTATELAGHLSDKVNGRMKFTSQKVGKTLSYLGYKRESKPDADKGYSVKGYYIKYTN